MCSKTLTRDLVAERCIQEAIHDYLLRTGWHRVPTDFDPDRTTLHYLAFHNIADLDDAPVLTITIRLDKPQEGDGS